ncbi:MAG: hypothetical protein EOO38_13230 [Cytophagaceae bacterium]|nr:MAG: hypothetical protein EOO38_13230 [Cytophagaceae bacterium]
MTCMRNRQLDYTAIPTGTTLVLMTLCALALPKVTVGLHDSSLPRLYKSLFPLREVSAMVSSSDEMFVVRVREPVVPYADARVRTEEVMLRMRGRRVAIEAAMMPVPGSAVAQMVALMASPFDYVSLER